MFTMHLGCVVEVDSGVSVVGWVRFGATWLPCVGSCGFACDQAASCSEVD